MDEKDKVEGEGFVIKDKRSSQISEDDASFLDDQEAKDSQEQEASSEGEKDELGDRLVKVSLFPSNLF